MTAIDKPSFPGLEFPTFAAGGFGDAIKSVQQRMTAITRASEALMQGALAAAEHQSSLRRDLVRETLDDLAGLSRAKGPQEFMNAEMSIVQRQAARSMRAMQAMQQEMLCCGILAWRAATDDDALIEDAMAEAEVAEKAIAQPTDRAA